jgi:hypothetical protein
MRERREDVVVGAGYRTRTVDVLDPHDPCAAMRARIQKTRQRGD